MSNGSTHGLLISKQMTPKPITELRLALPHPQTLSRVWPFQNIGCIITHMSKSMWFLQYSCFSIFTLSKCLCLPHLLTHRTLASPARPQDYTECLIASAGSWKLILPGIENRLGKKTVSPKLLVCNMYALLGGCPVVA